jgi:DNA-binding NtrC family response regulator
MASDPPDLVISDIQMPEMDGIEYLQRIREDYPDLPVILMTGYATADSAISALRNRACDYLQKPVSLQELQGCIDRIISDRQP